MIASPGIWAALAGTAYSGLLDAHPTNRGHRQRHNPGATARRKKRKAQKLARRKQRGK